MSAAATRSIKRIFKCNGSIIGGESQATFTMPSDWVLANSIAEVVGFCSPSGGGGEIAPSGISLQPSDSADSNLQISQNEIVLNPVLSSFQNNTQAAIVSGSLTLPEYNNAGTITIAGGTGNGIGVTARFIPNFTLAVERQANDASIVTFNCIVTEFFQRVTEIAQD